MSRHCESLGLSSGLPCGRAAKWLVQVGTRKADAQFCCGRHLSMTCTALYEADNPRKPALTVTAVAP